MAKERKDIAPEDTWNLESIYPNIGEWEKDYEKIGGLVPGLASFQEQLGDKDKLFECLTLATDINRLFEKVSAFALRRADEDLGNDENSKRKDLVMQLAAQFSAAAAFIEPELSDEPDAYILALSADPQFKDYDRYLLNLLRQKKHLLSKEQEELLAQHTEVFAAHQKTAEQLRNNDMKFPAIKTGTEERELTNSTFAVLRRDPNRDLRRQAMENFFGTYGQFRTTLCSALGAHIKLGVIHARARKYDFIMDQFLDDDNLPRAIYQTLFEVADQHLPLLHRYCELRRKRLGVDVLHWHDLYVPIVEETQSSFSYDEAVETVLAALAPLGEEYVTALRAGLTRERWIDKYENKGKRSGAYSAGSYNNFPFILLNFQHDSDSVSTLAHEAGHSMHTHLAKSSQPYTKYDYPIFLAEIASTLNEILLNKHLLKDADPKTRLSIINQQLEDIRTTFFRQTMFAEFEAGLYEHVWGGGVLAPQDLEDRYFTLNQRYYGPKTVIDKPVRAEWSFIPHFYFGFYVYKYATSLAMALYFADQVLNGGPKELENYLNLLRAGNCDHPAELLKKAGLDVSKPDYLLALMKEFERLLDEFEEQSEKK